MGRLAWVEGGHSGGIQNLVPLVRSGGAAPRTEGACQQPTSHPTLAGWTAAGRHGHVHDSAAYPCVSRLPLAALRCIQGSPAVCGAGCAACPQHHQQQEEDAGAAGSAPHIRVYPFEIMSLPCERELEAAVRCGRGCSPRNPAGVARCPSSRPWLQPQSYPGCEGVLAAGLRESFWGYEATSAGHGWCPPGDAGGCGFWAQCC